MPKDVRYSEKNLTKLRDMDNYEVSDDDPDIRGWKVMSKDDKVIGKVDELIVDTAAMKVRYIDIDVNDSISGVKDKHLLYPIGLAELDEKKDIVYADHLETVTLLKYPRYSGEEIDRSYEKEVRRNFKQEKIINDTEFYNDDIYNDENFKKRRERQQLYRLHELPDYNPELSEPDVSNWDVYNSDGEKIGSVYELIVDPKLKKIRYLEVELDKDFAREDQKRILVPIGLASLDDSENRVHINLNRSALDKMPPYTGGVVDRAYENSLRNSVTLESTGADDPAANYYDHEHYNDSLFYKKRGEGIRWSS